MNPPEGAVLLMLPFVIGGGAERMLSGVSASLVAGGRRVLAVTTRPTPFGYGDRSDWFRRAGVELFDLPAILKEREWLDFLDELIARAGVSVLWQTGSDYLYRALRELRSEHGHLRVVDSLFNGDVHVRRHVALRELIDVAIVESDVVGQKLIAGGVRRDRIVTIPNGVDVTRFCPPDRAGTSAAPTPCGAGLTNVGFVGRLAQEKDPLAFVALANDCRDLPLRFHIAGDGPLAGPVRRRRRRRRLEDSVLLHGFREDVEQLYRELDVVVVPSTADGRPNVALEALAMGVPVLASPVGSLPEIVTHGVNGFLCSSVSEFAEHVRWLHAHPQQLHEMRNAARSAAVHEFDATQSYGRYQQVISELAGDRQGMAAPA
ncbi:MAG: glycosyltransferase family 4 protein [Solirubrobacteraceae bacterium]